MNENLKLDTHIENILKERYYLKDEDSWSIVSKRLSETILPEIEPFISSRTFIPSTPTIMNLNTKGERKGTLSSCFILGIEDSMESIMDSMKEAAYVTKAAGGVGYNFSSLRGSNEVVESNKKNSGGPLAFIGIFDAVLDGVRQGGSRRGAGMSLLSIDHPDILKFIDAKQKEGVFERSNFSVGTKNAFYEVLESDPNRTFQTRNIVDGKLNDLVDDNGRTYTYQMLWDRLIHNAWTRAEPGIFNEDISADRCSCKHITRNVFCNPCIRDSVRVLTPTGTRMIKELSVGELIWSKEGWTKVTRIFLTGNKEVFEYITAAGTFESTENHEVISNGLKIPVGNAESLDTLLGEKINEITINPELVMDGLVIGDGSVDVARNNLVFLYIKKYNSDYFKSEVKDLILIDRPVGLRGWEIKTSVVSTELPEAFSSSIPERFLKLSKSDTASFLRGLYSAKGSVCGRMVTYKTASFKMVKDLQVLLSSIGISSYYIANKPTIVSLENGEYLYKQFYDVNITTHANLFYDYIGFIQKRNMDKIKTFLNEKRRPYRGKTNFNIVEVNSLGLFDVWDITVDNESHTFWCDGFNISNCSEYNHIPYTSCNLGSINISHFVKGGRMNWESLEKLVDKTVIYLNGIIDQNDYPLEKIRKETLNVRPIGLGMMGLAHAMYLKGIPYDSQEGYDFVCKLSRFMTLVGMRKSVELAKEHGKSYPYYDYATFMDANARFFTEDNFIGIDVLQLKKDIAQYGIYNSCITSVAPTGTISYIADCSSGMEPVFGLVFTRKIEKENKIYEHVYMVDPIFKKHIESNHAADAEKIYKYVTSNKGSCQKCTFLTPKEQSLFKVAGDISPDWHLKILSAVANNISLSVSKTINLPGDCNEKELSEVFLKAHDLGIIGVTVYRDGCRRGILVHEDSPSKINKTVAPKRPAKLKGEAHQFIVDGKRYYCCVGLMDDNPFEIFTGKNMYKDGEIFIPRQEESGSIVKRAKQTYVFISKDGAEYHLTNGHSNDTADAVSRLLSMNLRHGADISFVVEQLGKVEGDMACYSKVLSRTLKRYIKDNTTSTDNCECGEKYIYVEGCKKCPACGNSKCG